MVGEKKTESVVNCIHCIHCMQYMKKENTLSEIIEKKEKSPKKHFVMKIPQKAVLGRIVKAFKGLNYSSRFQYYI